MKTKQTFTKADHENLTDVYKRAKKYMLEDNKMYVDIDYDGIVFELGMIDNENTAYRNFKQAHEAARKHEKAHYTIIMDNSAPFELHKHTDLDEAISELQRLSLKERKSGVIYKSVVLSKISIVTQKIK
jgi:hypothetical protein